ncbi:hypothetical protein F5Y10DRAFT_244513 [Nemania abortiva]|nr:hypothetical protein F5Y10DRAFT_244513 [Nemania abortiva]
MIVHSHALCQTIRDVVKAYPDQNLNGTGFVVHEPYACLIHHMSDFENLTSLDRDVTELEHLQVLLEFLQPRYKRYCIPAIERSLTVQPMIRFDDLWLIMKPGSLGYVELNGYKHGCILDKCILFPPSPSKIA